MPSYIETTLIKDEKVLYSAKLSIFILIPSFLMGLILMSISAPLGLLVWMVGIAHFAFSYFTTELGITNKRLIAKFGVIKRNTIELNLSKIESIKVSQSIFGRMLNYGTINAVGTGGTSEPIRNISDPIAFRKAFSAISDEAESSRNPAVAQAVADSVSRSREQSGVRLEQGPQGDTVFCTECGVRNSTTASFCSGCGKKIERSA